jgi:hypothetical protein
VRERVEHVRDGDDAPDDRDALAGKAAGVSAAVPPLVVRCGDHRGHLQHGGAAARQQPRAERRVGLHRITLFGREPSTLEQDAVRDRDLADIVQRRSFAQTPDLLATKSQADGDIGGEHSDTFGVLGGLVVAVLDRWCAHGDDVPAKGRRRAPCGVLVDECTSGGALGSSVA